MFCLFLNDNSCWPLYHNFVAAHFQVESTRSTGSGRMDGNSVIPGGHALLLPSSRCAAGDPGHRGAALLRDKAAPVWPAVPAEAGRCRGSPGALHQPVISAGTVWWEYLVIKRSPHRYLTFALLGGVWTPPSRGFSRIERKRRGAASPGFHLPYPPSFW